MARGRPWDALGASGEQSGAPGERSGPPGERSGMPRERSGAPGELPCTPLGCHLGSIWAPFWLRFGVFVALDFPIRLLLDFGSILVSILAPFWCPNSTPEALRREKVDLQKTMFSLRKTMVLGVGECPGAAKIASGRHQKRMPNNTSKKDA